LLCASPAKGQSGQDVDIATTRITSSIKLARLVDLTAEHNRVEIEYRSNTLSKEPVTLRLVHEVTPQELWDLCLTILHSNELTIIHRPGNDRLYAVVTLSQAAKETLPASSLDLGPLSPGYQSVIRRLTSVDPDSVIELTCPHTLYHSLC